MFLWKFATNYMLYIFFATSTDLATNTKTPNIFNLIDVIFGIFSKTTVPIGKTLRDKNASFAIYYVIIRIKFLEKSAFLAIKAKIIVRSKGLVTWSNF